MPSYTYDPASNPIWPYRVTEEWRIEFPEEAPPGFSCEPDASNPGWPHFYISRTAVTLYAEENPFGPYRSDGPTGLGVPRAWREWLWDWRAEECETCGGAGKDERGECGECSTTGRVGLGPRLYRLLGAPGRAFMRRWAGPVLVHDVALQVVDEMERKARQAHDAHIEQTGDGETAVYCLEQSLAQARAFRAWADRVFREMIRAEECPECDKGTVMYDAGQAGDQTITGVATCPDCLGFYEPRLRDRFLAFAVRWLAYGAVRTYAGWRRLAGR